MTEIEASYGMILVNDALGYKSKSSFKKFVSGVSRSEVDVPSGELLVALNGKSDHFNYQLYRDPKIYLSCKEDDIVPLNHQGFLLLEAVKDPASRLDVFQTKLEWGRKVQEGSVVCITLPGLFTAEDRARATLRYKGAIGNEPSIWFGVEIVVRFLP